MPTSPAEAVDREPVRRDERSVGLGVEARRELAVEGNLEREGRDPDRCQQPQREQEDRVSEGGPPRHHERHAGHELEDHRRRHDRTDPRDVRRFIHGEAVPPDLRHQRVLDPLHQPTEAHQVPGRGEMHEQ